MSHLRIENEMVCSHCGENVVVDHKNGKIRCTSCGLVKEDRFVDLSSEYRFFMENTSPQNDPRRVGNIVNPHMDSQIDLIEIDNGKRVLKRLIPHVCHPKQHRQDVHASDKNHKTVLPIFGPQREHH